MKLPENIRQTLKALVMEEVKKAATPQEIPLLEKREALAQELEAVRSEEIERMPQVTAEAEAARCKWNEAREAIEPLLADFRLKEATSWTASMDYERRRGTLELQLRDTAPEALKAWLSRFRNEYLRLVQAIPSRDERVKRSLIHGNVTEVYSDSPSIVRRAAAVMTGIKVIERMMLEPLAESEVQAGRTALWQGLPEVGEKELIRTREAVAI